ncbi:MAG: hypothetical protein KIH63_002725 [Candidatus Saccharibacteria bacterium]|nr:hypothetical protein [Candidatus Saccharibacteria bacterium]
MGTYIDQLNSFTLASLPDLDTVVMGALELFQSSPVPDINTNLFKHPLVVGSGNAEATGRIIFRDSDAVFASESDFAAKLQAIPSIDGVVLISASGAKHAPIIAAKAREMGKQVALITNTEHNETAAKFSQDSNFQQFVYPKNREPYTYNTSTYMGMILGSTGEDPAAIATFLQETIAGLGFPDFSQYQKYYLIVPPQFAGIIRMLNVKFIELFGRNIARDIETSEYVRHATTVAPSKELFISFGEENTTWGKPEDRLYVPLPERAGYGAMMAVGYYTIAQIQKQYAPFFKDNIEAYTAEISRVFGSTITPIVEK